VLLLGACTGKPPADDTVETSGETSEDTVPESADDTTVETAESEETGEDSETAPTETGVVGLVYAAEIDLVEGHPTGGSGGAEWVSGGLHGATLCSLLGGWTESAAPQTPCAACTFAFAVALVDPALGGDRCATLGVDAALLDAWSPAWGWAAEAEVYPGEVLPDVLFAWYPPPYDAWQPVAWEGRGEVQGSAEHLSLRIQSGLYYYLPAR
jgi:hypothetical protein